MPAAAPAGGLPNKLGKYEIMMPLAAGGMARIYIGRASGIGSFERHVVLKVILPERANDHTAVQMFLDEARLAASLNHQNVAQVFEVGQETGIHYLAMEYVHGQDLRALLARAGSQGTRVPLELALTIVAGAASGLHHAHDRRGPDGQPLGIVHRDVSPSNIMVGYDGAVKLLDFGIAKAAQRSIETQSGIIKGKFAYMAPEQCRGRDVDRRSDVFSLGIILYEVTTQHRCFRADSDFDTMHRIVTGDVVRPTRLVPGYPQALEAVVMKALAVDANQRYQSAGHLLEAIETFAVNSRMSLSTMALGRFMREMFGEVVEPWLQSDRYSGAVAAQPIRESTVSNTNNPGNRIDDDLEIPQASADPGQPQGRTILDLPRPVGVTLEDSEPNVAEWNAKSYPAVEHAFVATPVPPEVLNRSAPHMAIPSAGLSTPGHAHGPTTHGHGPLSAQMPHATPPPGSISATQPATKAAMAGALSATQPAMKPAPSTAQMPAPMAAMPAQHSQPTSSPGIALPPTPQTPPHGYPQLHHAPQGSHPPLAAQQAFQTPPSESGAAFAPTAIAPPIVGSSTAHGYASPGQSNTSHPRYEADQSIANLTPNRRGLWIALGAMLLAGVAIAVIVIASGSGGGSKDKDSKTETPVITPGSGDGSSKEAVSPPMPTPVPTPPMPTPAHTGSGSDAGSNAVANGSGSASTTKPPEPTNPTPTPPTNGSAIEPDTDLISVHVASEPVIGADVYVDGKKLGVTPLDVKIKRGTGAATLVVKHPKFADATAKIDTTGDFSKQITLKPKDEHQHTPTPPNHTPTPPNNTPKPKCQQPGPNMDPFTPVCGK